MELQEMFQSIGLPPAIVESLEAVEKKVHREVCSAEIDAWVNRLLDISTADLAYRQLQAMLGEDPDCLKMLYCQLEGARRAFDRYEEKHIPLAVYRDTMKCFTRFLGESQKINGRLFFDRGWWTYRQIGMGIFRLGALEYERREREEEPVIDLHIPSDADLSEEAVEDSLRQANRFFQTYYGEYSYGKLTCNSWLLSPSITPMLSEKSRIGAFQKRFQILREDKEDTEYIQYLYQVPEDTDCKKFPERTSLQREVKKLILKGGNIGSAFGIMKNLRAGVFLLALTISLTGCGPAPSTYQMPEEIQRELGQEKAQEQRLDRVITEDDERIRYILEGAWDVVGTDEVYQFEYWGEGERRAEGETVSFSYVCGQDEKYRDLLYIKAEEKEEEALYEISYDETGCRLRLMPVGDEQEEKLLTPSGGEFLDMTDERVAALEGDWREAKTRLRVTEDMELIYLSSGDKMTITVILREGKEEPEICFTDENSNLFNISRYEFALEPTRDALRLNPLDMEGTPGARDYYIYWRRLTDEK